jgi:hypothetical protein
MHNFILAAAKGSYVFRLHKAAIIRLVYMGSTEPKHVASIYNCYSKFVR